MKLYLVELVLQLLQLQCMKQKKQQSKQINLNVEGGKLKVNFEVENNGISPMFLNWSCNFCF